MSNTVTSAIPTPATVEPPLSESMLPIKPVSLRDQVYDAIRQAILDRRLKPGDHIRGQELTELLDVSRTPLREALGLAERDGLVQYVPNRGWFVTKFTPPEIREIFSIRCGLENLAADMIIDRLTEAEFAELTSQIAEFGRVILRNDAPLRSKLDLAFHQRLVELSGNQRLLRMWCNIAIQCSMVFNYHTVTIPDYDHWQGVRDHTAILDALRSRDPVAVHAVNDGINRRVADQCIAGFLAVESRH
jgi:DNA-binding GntR family transcriptional regulator